MRVLVAPDKFAGTLSAVQAATAIATGWTRRCPDDEIDLLPMSDGGPGFIEVLAQALGGDLLAATVTGPYGEPVPATILRVGETAYVESAQAIGLDLTPTADRDPERATSAGVGELIEEAVASGARRVIVGLGGSATNDGGAGVLDALGATAAGAVLDQGPIGLRGLESLDLAPAQQRLAGVEVLAATDVDATLTGLFGATKSFGPQKGLAEERLPVVDGWLEELSRAADFKLATAKGAGAAGGVGYALLLLGGTRVSGLDLIAEAVDLPGRLARADLVVTGEGAFDFSSRSGKVPYGVASAAAQALVPCIALAGQVLIGAREMRAIGIESAYSLVERVGEERAFGDTSEALAELAERVARSWGGQAPGR